MSGSVISGRQSGQYGPGNPHPASAAAGSTVVSSWKLAISPGAQSRRNSGQSSFFISARPHWLQSNPKKYLPSRMLMASRMPPQSIWRVASGTYAARSSPRAAEIRSLSLMVDLAIRVLLLVQVFYAISDGLGVLVFILRWLPCTECLHELDELLL